MRFLSFFNLANVSRNHALPGEPTTGHLSSVGIGFRGTIDNNIQLRLDLSNVLDAGGVGSIGQKQAQASLIYMY